MISLRMCLIACAIVIVAVQMVSSLQCWVCNAGKDCDAKKVNTTCNARWNACLSILTKDKKPFELSCARKASALELCDTNVHVNCKVCEKDLCNSSSFVAPSIFTITIFAAVVTKMYF